MSNEYGHQWSQISPWPRVSVRNAKRIVGLYKDNIIEIEREKDGRFYIFVSCPRVFGVFYDGWWGNSNNTINEALQEAFIGSKIAEDKRP